MIRSNTVTSWWALRRLKSPTIVYSTVYSVTGQWKHKNSASLAFVSPHKGPVTREMFPFDDVIKFFVFYEESLPFGGVILDHVVTRLLWACHLCAYTFFKELINFNQNLVKMYVALAWKIIIILVDNFAHFTSVVMWHGQNSGLIG